MRTEIRVDRVLPAWMMDDINAMLASMSERLGDPAPIDNVADFGVPGVDVGTF